MTEIERPPLAVLSLRWSDYQYLLKLLAQQPVEAIARQRSQRRGRHRLMELPRQLPVLGFLQDGSEELMPWTGAFPASPPPSRVVVVTTIDRHRALCHLLLAAAEQRKERPMLGPCLPVAAWVDPVSGALTPPAQIVE